MYSSQYGTLSPSTKDLPAKLDEKSKSIKSESSFKCRLTFPLLKKFQNLRTAEDNTDESETLFKTSNNENLKEERLKDYGLAVEDFHEMRKNELLKCNLTRKSNSPELSKLGIDDITLAQGFFIY